MYFSINSDDVGSKFGDMASQNNEQGLSDLSSQLKEAHAMIDQWVMDNGGKVIASSGDENLFFLENPEGLEQLLADYSEHTGNSVTVGVGDSISNAIKAMIFGKKSGKNQINEYSPEMEDSFGEQDEAQEGQEDNQQAPQDQVPNDSATPPELDPTNQLPSGDPENPDFAGNDITENGGPKPGGPVDMENGVDEKTTQPAESKVPQQSSVQSQIAPNASNAPNAPFSQNQVQPKGNSVTPPMNMAAQTATPPQKVSNSGNLPPQKVSNSPISGSNNSQPAEKTIEMPVDNLVNEHESLVDTLKSPSHEDDQQEANVQGEELQEYKAVQDGSESPEEVEQDESQEGQNPGELSNVMDSQSGDNSMDEEVSNDTESQDGVGIPNNEGNQTEVPEDGMEDGLQEMGDEAGDENVDVESLRSEIAQNLVMFRENKSFFEQIRNTQPKFYLATISMLRNMILMAKQLGMTPGSDMDKVAGQALENTNTPQQDNKMSVNSKQETDKKPFPPKKSAESKDGEEKTGEKKAGGFPPKKDEKKTEEPKKDEKKAPPFGKK